MNQEIFAKRRAKFLTKMEGGVAVIFAAPHATRNADSHYKYRTDSSFYYLTGFTEPGAIAVFAPDTEAPYRIFVPPKDPLRETWDGKRLGVDAAKGELKADVAYSNADFDRIFRELLKRAGKLHYHIGNFPEQDQRMLSYVSEFTPRVRDGEKAIRAIMSAGAVIGEMRKVKDALDLDIMRKNCQNSARAHSEAMQFTRPGMFEYQVEAKINQSFVDGGAETLAYTSIIAAGNNATVLHYVSNRDKMNDGDLLLIDAGGEMNCYASDITRTFPVNGKFTAPQKRVYDIVLQAQLAAIAVAKPGIQYSEMHRRATEVLVEGLLDLGILKGNRDDIIRAKTHMKFYPHGTGHWLGLDVHDSGTYFTDDGNSILLEPGHVMTVEPGLYFTKEDQSVPEEYRGIGIRIEDDVLITEKGNEIMTADVVKETRDIENLMGR